MDDLAITCHESIEPYDEKAKTVPTNFNEKKTVLLTIALLIAVIIYCYLIKYRAKQKHLLPFHVTSSKLKEIIF